MELYRLVKEAENKGYSKEKIDVTHITESLSEVREGSLFAAIKGEHFDGNELIDDAVRRGAVAIITERSDISDVGSCVVISVADVRKALAYAANEFYGRPAEKLCIIGITGTNGKTTTAHMLSHILNGNGLKCGVIGTVGAFIGEKWEDISQTTPNAVKLFALLSDMVKCGMTHVVMEVSSHALDQERVFGIKFKVGIFTNLSVDHLDYHGDMKRYAHSKLRLFERSEICIANKDSDFSQPFVSFKKEGTRVLTFSAHADSDFRAENISVTTEGNRYDVVMVNNFTPVAVTQRICGLFNVYNSLAAFAAASILGLSNSEISAQLSSFLPVRGRMEKVETDKDYSVIIDFAHTPDGLGNVLSSLRQCCKGKILAVFGCGGNRDKSKRPMMGNVVEALSDMVIVTSDNPRDEDPMDIINDILVGIKDLSKVKVIPDRREAIRYALSIAEKNDTVLLAGKGHETYQTVKGIKYHFDEREVIAEYIKGR